SHMAAATAGAKLPPVDTALAVHIRSLSSLVMSTPSSRTMAKTTKAAQTNEPPLAPLSPATVRPFRDTSVVEVPRVVVGSGGQTATRGYPVIGTDGLGVTRRGEVFRIGPSGFQDRGDALSARGADRHQTAHRFARFLLLLC